ncbi:MAG: hypothetical protein H7203_00285 [Rhizobacter sp.]|nr:hypothetical protein [Burkholderiales bacterium]
MNFAKNIDKAQDTATMYGKQVTNGVENAVDSARDVAQDALSSVSNKIDSIHDQAKPAVDRMVARGKDMADSAIASTREASERAKKAVSGYATSCENYITDQPMKSVAMAAAAGATIAALLLLSRNRANQRARYDR